MAGEDWWQSSNKKNEKILLIGQRVTKNVMEVGNYRKMCLEAAVQTKMLMWKTDLEKQEEK